jgi:streptogramin lyase
VTSSEKAFYESVGALDWGGISAVPGAQAPRRLGADKNGNFVWVPLYLGMKLARIDIRTLETKYYPLPFLGTAYFLTVDKDHNVWTQFTSDDRVVKFNPKVEQWTVYDLPSHGCRSANITADDLRGEVWVACTWTTRLNRLQFRTAQQLQALK